MHYQTNRDSEVYVSVRLLHFLMLHILHVFCTSCSDLEEFYWYHCMSDGEQALEKCRSCSTERSSVVIIVTSQLKLSLSDIIRDGLLKEKLAPYRARLTFSEKL